MEKLKSFESQAPRNIFIPEIYLFGSQISAVDAFTFKPEAISPDATLAVFRDVNPRLQYVLLDDYHIFQDAEVIHEEGYCKVLQIVVDAKCSFPRDRVRQVSKCLCKGCFQDQSKAYQYRSLWPLNNFVREVPENFAKCDSLTSKKGKI
jgi:hypothetical protein